MIFLIRSKIIKSIEVNIYSQLYYLTIKTLIFQGQCPVQMAEISSDQQSNVEALDNTQRRKKKKGFLEQNSNAKLSRSHHKWKGSSGRITYQGERDIQSKLTKYFSNTNSKQTVSRQETIQDIRSDIQLKVQELENQLKNKENTISELRDSKERQIHKFSAMYLEAKEFKRKTRMILAKALSETASFIRRQKAVIDLKMGYFKDGMRVFVEGEIFTQLRAQIKWRQQQINRLQSDRKSNKDFQLKQRINCSIELLNKRLIQLRKQLSDKQNDLNCYKQRLKLAQKQSKCQHAKDNWPIIYQNYQTLQLLGSGGFGQVYKCFDFQSNNYVALKVNKLQLAKQDPKHQQEFIKHVKRQAQTHLSLTHPNIAKFLKLLDCSSSYIIFTLEYCSGPQLSKYMKKYGSLQEKQAKMIIKQIFNALNYLYGLKEKVIHYDLKPSNVIFHNGVVKLLDFGLCKIMETNQTKIDLTSQGVGTYWYLPPETFDQYAPKVSSKVDVWSAGVIFFQMLYGKKPFGHGYSQNKIFTQGIILRAQNVIFPAQTPKKYKVSQSAKEFIRACLSYETDQRLNPRQAYQHPYFRK